MLRWFRDETARSVAALMVGLAALLKAVHVWLRRRTHRRKRHGYEPPYEDE